MNLHIGDKDQKVTTYIKEMMKYAQLFIFFEGGKLFRLDKITTTVFGTFRENLFLFFNPGKINITNSQ